MSAQGSTNCSTSCQSSPLFSTRAGAWQRARWLLRSCALGAATRRSRVRRQPSARPSPGFGPRLVGAGASLLRAVRGLTAPDFTPRESPATLSDRALLSRCSTARCWCSARPRAEHEKNSRRRPLFIRLRRTPLARPISPSRHLRVSTLLPFPCLFVFPLRPCPSVPAVPCRPRPLAPALPPSPVVLCRPRPLAPALPPSPVVLAPGAPPSPWHASRFLARPAPSRPPKSHHLTVAALRPHIPSHNETTSQTLALTSDIKSALTTSQRNRLRDRPPAPHRVRGHRHLHSAAMAVEPSIRGAATHLRRPSPLVLGTNAVASTLSRRRARPLACCVRLAHATRTPAPGEHTSQQQGRREPDSAHPILLSHSNNNQ